MCLRVLTLSPISITTCFSLRISTISYQPFCYTLSAFLFSSLTALANVGCLEGSGTPKGNDDYIVLIGFAPFICIVGGFHLFCPSHRILLRFYLQSLVWAVARLEFPFRRFFDVSKDSPRHVAGRLSSPRRRKTLVAVLFVFVFFFCSLTRGHLCSQFAFHLDLYEVPPSFFLAASS